MTKILQTVFIVIFINVSMANGTELFESYTMGLGCDYRQSNPNLVRPNAYINIYNLPIKPFELETQLFTMSIVKMSGKLRYAFPNLVLPSIAWMCLLYGNDNRFFGYGLAGALFQAPIALGNFKIHLPIIKDGIHLYVGEATDYFLWWPDVPIYTESRAGIKIFIGPIAMEAALSKPWIKGQINNDGLLYTFGFGIYTSRKQMEKNRNGKWPTRLSLIDTYESY